MSVLRKFKILLGDNLIVGDAPITFDFDESLFMLDIPISTPAIPFPIAVGALHDLGQSILLECKLILEGYKFYENQDEVCWFCNDMNRLYPDCKLILNYEYRLEFMLKTIFDKDNWYNTVVRMLEDYVRNAKSFFEGVCKDYGELV